MVTENEQVVEEKVEAEETPPAEEPVASDTDLAQEALEVTEEKPEADPKDAVIGGMRRKLRAAELETARLQGQMQAQQVRPPEPSPLELAAKEQGVSVDEVDINGKLYKAQQAWEKNQAQGQAQQQVNQDYQSGSEAASLTMTDENLGEGLGLESLAKLGDHLLTDSDRQEIYLAGKKCGSVFYKKLKQRIQETDGAEAQELQKRLTPQKKSKKEQLKTDEAKAKAEAEAKAKAEGEPPPAEVILDAPAAHIGQVFDLED